VEEHGTARWVADEYIHSFIHSFIHSLHFPYIHIQVEYQACGDCHSCCNNMCQSYKCQMFQYTYNYNYNNNFIFRTVTTKCVLLPVLYLINRIKIMYEIISLLRIIFFYPPIYLSFRSCDSYRCLPEPKPFLSVYLLLKFIIFIH